MEKDGRTLPDRREENMEGIFFGLSVLFKTRRRTFAAFAATVAVDVTFAIVELNGSTFLNWPAWSCCIAGIACGCGG